MNPAPSVDPSLLASARRAMREHNRLVEIWTDWVACGSGSNDACGLAKMARILEAELASLPAPVERITTEAAGVGPIDALSLTVRPEAPFRVLLNGHYDTVYSPSFPGPAIRRTGERLYGPGVTDMKGGLLVMMEALRIFETLPSSSQLGWEVLITADEETGSESSRPLLEAAARRNHCALAYESSLPDGALIRNRMGTGSFTLACKGRSAHVGRDFNNGRNAIVGLAAFISEVASLNERLPGCILNPGRITGGEALNVVPEFAEVHCNFRAATPGDAQALKCALDEITNRLNVGSEGLICSWRGDFTRPPKVVDPAAESLFRVVRDCGSALGLDLTWRDTGGAADGNFLSHFGLPNIDNLGVRGGGIHSSGEFALIDSLEERILLSVLILNQLASTPPATLNQ